MPTLMLELASASLPNPLRRLACLHACTPLQMRLQHCPHHSLCFRTCSSSSPQLTVLTLLWSPQVMPLAPPSPPLTPPCTRVILSATYHPHACAVPYQHASNTAYHPNACGAPSQHASNATYHPYACIVPARHASNTAYHPYGCSALPMLLTILMLMECLPDMPPMPLTILTLFPPDMPPMLLTILMLAVTFQHPPHTGLILKAAYDPYTHAAPHLRPHHPCLIFSAAYNSYTPAAPSRYASDTTLNPHYA
ncbi:hypothetical protein O181_029536 [Austropuccinia psidii MF-1]|uniref:Uncharacterized protein n=1 Tax=Austropuccinia psidii MF-1 TaxID=1389203 RepID=A0A9Q3H3E1_9BASI|nr:hypothetical protein [Austropuccinia psidii MF-1]